MSKKKKSIPEPSPIISKVEGKVERKGERVQATEQEIKDFENYEKEVEKQKGQIDSYEGLLKKKERDAKQHQIDKWLNVLMERYTNLKGQGEQAGDRLGFDANFYKQVWTNMKQAQDDFMNGDIQKQYDFLQLIASNESNAKAASAIMYELDGKFNKVLRKIQFSQYY